MYFGSSRYSLGTVIVRSGSGYAICMTRPHESIVALAVGRRSANMRMSSEGAPRHSNDDDVPEAVGHSDAKVSSQTAVTLGWFPGAETCGVA